MSRDALPLAHETWFVEDDVAGDWGFLGETLSLVLLACAVALTVAARLVARSWPGVDIPWLARMAPFMPFAMRIHLAVSLVGLLSLGFYLSPAMDLEFDVAGVLLGAVMIITAISMVAGWHVRAGAWLLIAAGPLGMLEFGVAAGAPTRGSARRWRVVPALHRPPVAGRPTGSSAGRAEASLPDLARAVLVAAGAWPALALILGRPASRSCVATRPGA